MAKLVRLKGVKQDSRGRTVYELVEMADADTAVPGQDDSDALGAIFMELEELTSAPAAPAANKVRIYALDNAGKTTVYAKFSSGSPVSLGAQP